MLKSAGKKLWRRRLVQVFKALTFTQRTRSLPSVLLSVAGLAKCRDPRRKQKQYDPGGWFSLIARVWPAESFSFHRRRRNTFARAIKALTWTRRPHSIPSAPGNAGAKKANKWDGTLDVFHKSSRGSLGRGHTDARNANAVYAAAWTEQRPGLDCIKKLRHFFILFFFLFLSAEMMRMFQSFVSFVGWFFFLIYIF